MIAIPDTRADDVYPQAGGNMLSSTINLSPSSRSCFLPLYESMEVYSCDLPRTIPGAQALDFLGPLGHVGMTAYFVSQLHAFLQLRMLILVGTFRA